MEPFAIHCTTCQTRLVVRDASAIGQILACPRCASMVLVEAPPGHEIGGKPGAKSPPGGAAPGGGGTPVTGAGPAGGMSAAEGKQVVRPRAARQHDSRADTLGDTFDDLDDLLAGRRPAPAETSPSSSTADSHDVAKSVETKSAGVASSVSAAPAASEASGTPRPVTGPTALPGPSAPAAPPELDADAVEPSLTHVARWSPTTIVLAAGGAGIVLAVSAALILIAGFGGQPTPVAVTPNDGRPSAEEPTDDGTESDDPSGMPSAVPPGSEKTDTNDGSNDDPVGKKPTVDPATPAAANPKPDESPIKPEVDTKNTEPAKPVSSGSDGDGKTPSKPGTADYAPKPAEPRRPLEVLGGKFAEFLNNAPLVADSKLGPQEGPDPAGKPTEPDSGKPSEEPTERAALPRPLAREIDVEARLADRLASVAYQNVPLIDFLAEVSEFSTIPMTLDLRALTLRRITVAAPVSVKLEGVTVEKLLAAALEPYQLVARPAGDGQVLVTIPSDESTREKRDYATEDLTGGEAAQLESLAALVTAFVTPEAWTAAGGDSTITTDEGRLTVEGPALVRLELEAFLDKLRVARKLKPVAKPPLPLDTLAVDGVASRAAGKLAATLKLNFGRPTRFTAILQRLGRDAGVRIVPNWQSLAAIGWTTDTQATVTIEGKPLHESLTALLEPMELDYRVVDEGTIEVVAARAGRMLLDVEFHALAGLPAEEPDALLRRLENECGAERFATNGGPAVLRFEPGSQCVVAAAPYAVQRRVAEVLAAWRKEATKKAE